MSNIIIEKQEIIKLLQAQFETIKNNNFNVYKDINFIIAEELQFNKIKDKSPDTIYMVVKFSPATFNFGQTTQNFTIEVLAEKNNIELSRMFLTEFVTAYNLSQSEDGKIVQAYTTPYVTTNFNYVYDGFRSVFSISGTLLISNTSNIYVESITYHYTEDGEEKSEEIDFLSFTDDTTNQLNSQPYGNTNGRTKSYATIQVYTFSIQTYSTNSQLIKDIIAARYGAISGANRDYKFSIKLKNNSGGFENWTFKCAGVHYQQEVAQLAIYSLTFTL